MKSGINTRMHLLEMQIEELCGRSTGMGGKARKNQEWWTTEVASAIGEKKEACKVIENMKVNRNQPDGGMLHLYGQKKNNQESCGQGQE